MRIFQPGDVVVTPMGRIGVVRRVERAEVDRAHIVYEGGETVALPTHLLKPSQRAPGAAIARPVRATPEGLDAEETRRIQWYMDLREGVIR